MTTSRNTVLSLDGKRGQRMTDEAAREILEAEGFTRRVRESVITHKGGRSETVVTIWESEDYRRRAVTKSTFAV
ncbi:hypothetical protein EV193_104353 [Herbihabitans rhizosphaerae]|uniref:Uncharacterized protein n=1 Tax=Herbihabitans rhizosphaerae TaxID=1872711 RepID=A0A4Q7KRN4_9PSEU|nr:hypothetical protein EV193_104353 [Herbihabitans rhizosphaerae]